MNYSIYDLEKDNLSLYNGKKVEEFLKNLSEKY
jgi:hypothetical protein